MAEIPPARRRLNVAQQNVVINAVEMPVNGLIVVINADNVHINGLIVVINADEMPINGLIVLIKADEMLINGLIVVINRLIGVIATPDLLPIVGYRRFAH